MMGLDPQVVDLVDRIREVFPDPGCPPGWGPECTLVGCDECDEMRELIRQKPHWSQWTVRDCRRSSPDLLGSGFVYYLPAYMIYSFTEWEALDVHGEFAVWSFIRDSVGVEPVGMKLIRQYTADQRDVIYDWLTLWVRTWEDRADSLEAYLAQVDRLREA